MSRGAHIVIAHLADGVQVLDYPSKASATARGTQLRRAGVVAYVHAVEFAAQFGLDPRAALRAQAAAAFAEVERNSDARAVEYARIGGAS